MSAAAADDTKACPYCAETIKAAAIKCRYCQSDLTTPAPAPAPAPEADPAPKATSKRTTKPEPQSEPKSEPKPEPKPEPKSAAGVEEQEPLAAAEGKRGGRGLWDVAMSSYTTAVLAAVVLALLVVGIVVNRAAGNDGTTSQGQVVDGQVRSVALTQGSELLQDALSYSYQDFDKVRARNQKKMSPAFRKEYLKAMDAAGVKTKKYQVTLKTTVVASGIQSITAHQAKVLLFINQVTSAEKGPDKTPTTQLNRTVVTLVRGAGDWRIAGIDPLAGGA